MAKEVAFTVLYFTLFQKCKGNRVVIVSKIRLTDSFYVNVVKNKNFNLLKSLQESSRYDYVSIRKIFVIQLACLNYIFAEF